MDLKTYLRIQAKEIEKYKWIESQKVGYDLGKDAINAWVEKNAKKFREEYNQFFNCYIEQILSHTKEKMKDVNEHLSDDDIVKICKIFAEEFTCQWTKDVSLPEHDKVIEAF